MIKRILTGLLVLAVMLLMVVVTAVMVCVSVAIYISGLIDSMWQGRSEVLDGYRETAMVVLYLPLETLAFLAEVFVGVVKGKHV